jgi:sirohydrochlorin ferrochelatase
VNRRVLLVDNGSLEPESTLQLRRLASALEDRVELRVDPVSLAHSGKIPRELLEGRPAELFEGALDRGWREGVTDFLVVPSFIGPSHAVTRQIPGLISERKLKWPSFRAHVTEPLFSKGDPRLGEILAEHIREKMTSEAPVRVAVVDHGSPNREVTAVRDEITDQVRALLGDKAIAVEACSMERREGAEYDFNEPLLKSLLSRPEWQSGPIIVGMLFIAPGRHAGPDGDVERICRDALASTSKPAVMTKLLGQHPRLLEILADRVKGAVG